MPGDRNLYRDMECRENSLWEKIDRLSSSVLRQIFLLGLGPWIKVSAFRAAGNGLLRNLLPQAFENVVKSQIDADLPDGYMFSPILRFRSAIGIFNSA